MKVRERLQSIALVFVFGKGQDVEEFFKRTNRLCILKPATAIWQSYIAKYP